MFLEVLVVFLSSDVSLLFFTSFLFQLSESLSFVTTVLFGLNALVKCLLLFLFSFLV